MITVTLEKRNGVAIGASENATMGIESKMLARPPQPLTANTTSSKCRLWVKMDKGGPVVEEWLVTETYATVKANLTTDDAEAGAELTANKVTSVSGASTDVQYPSAKLLYDQLVLKANLADPTFTGTPRVPTAASDTNSIAAASTAFVQNKKCVRGTASGTDTYTATIVPAITPAEGTLLMIRFTNANTGAATLNGAAIVRKNGSTALSANDLLANSWYQLYHDGTSFVLLGSA